MKTAKSLIPKDSYVMIIGAMKCGTTSLFNYLLSHPEICCAIDKEPEFFSENQQHGVDADSYESLFNFDPKIHKCTLEASTGYTKYPSEPRVPRNILAYGINPRFIYLVRNPFDRILSQYYFISRTTETPSEEELDYMISISNYFVQLEEFRKCFSKDRFLLLNFDCLKNQPKKVLLDIYRYLNLSPNYLPTEFPVFNATDISEAEKNRLILSDSHREHIYRRLKDDMGRLSDQYGINTANWGF